MFVSVSATTRPPRPGEVDGVHYLFVDRGRSSTRLVAEDELLEWAVVHGRHRYGTPRAPVLAAIAEAGREAVLEIDLQGARQVRAPLARRPPGLPGPAVLGRAGPSAGRSGHRDRGANATRRLDTATRELAAESEFDTTVVNRDVGHAVADLVALLGL